MKSPVRFSISAAVTGIFIVGFQIISYGQFTAGLDAGYDLGIGKGLLGQNSNTTYTQSGGTTVNSFSNEGVYGSWGQGFHIDARLGAALCRHIGVGLDVSYFTGKKFSTSDALTNNITQTSTTDDYVGKLTSIRVTPYVEISGNNNCGGITPYARLGLQLNVFNRMKQDITESDKNAGGTTNTDATAKLTGKFGIGFNAAAGVRYRLNDKLGLLGELCFSNSSFMPDKLTITKYSVNGADQLDALSTAQKETDYVKSYSTTSSTPNPNDPTKALANPEPAGGFGLSVGLTYSLGKTPDKKLLNCNCDDEAPVIPNNTTTVGNDCKCLQITYNMTPAPNKHVKATVREKEVKEYVGKDLKYSYLVTLKFNVTIECDKKDAEGNCEGTLYLTGKIGGNNKGIHYSLTSSCPEKETYPIEFSLNSPNLSESKFNESDYTVTFTFETVCNGKMKRVKYTADLNKKQGTGLNTPEWTDPKDVPDKEKEELEKDYKDYTHNVLSGETH